MGGGRGLGGLWRGCESSVFERFDVEVKSELSARKQSDLA